MANGPRYCLSLALGRILGGHLRVEQLCQTSTRPHRSVGKGKSMSDVEKEIDELQCKLTAKTREIETLVAEKLNLGDINVMEGTAYDRLRIYVEELIEKWQRADVDHPGSKDRKSVV